MNTTYKLISKSNCNTETVRNTVYLSFAGCHSNIAPKQEDFAEPDTATFKYSDLQIKLAPKTILQRPINTSELNFGKSFTDHIFKVSYHKNRGGWQVPKIIPFEDIVLHPASKVFHYAVQLFEGLKAYRGVDNKIRLFRPHLNMARMNLTAIRCGLPTFNANEMLKCIEQMVKIEQKWIPYDNDLCSLYIRPTMIGTDAALGVGESKSALLYTIMGPVGTYFKCNDGISLFADPNFTRAFPGGCGDKKMGSNYAPTIFVQKLANERNHDQVLWLYGDDHQITEVGTMNIFVFLINQFGEKELVTPPLNGLILPGITRQSVLELAHDLCPFKVSQRVITMKEVVQSIKKNTLLEMFGVGTACVISPIKEIEYLNQRFHIKTTEHKDPLYEKFRKKLVDIQFGRQQHPWSLIIS